MGTNWIDQLRKLETRYRHVERSDGEHDWNEATVRWEHLQQHYDALIYRGPSVSPSFVLLLPLLFGSFPASPFPGSIGLTTMFIEPLGKITFLSIST